MGKPFEKHSRLFALPVSTVLADQKAPIRNAALQTLTSMATACDGLESMVSGFTTAMETSNPLQKGTLFHWIADWYKNHEPSSSLDIRSWAPLAVACLDDRSSDVRKGAQALLPILIRCAGYDFVMQQTNSMKPASRASAIPLIQAMRPAVSVDTPAPSIVKAPAASTATTLPTSDSPPPQSPIELAGLSAKPSMKAVGVRRKLPQGSSRPDSRAENPDAASKVISGGIKRQGVTPTSRTQGTQLAPSSLSLPFSGANMDAKKARLSKDANKWVNDGGPTRKDLAELLQTQMESHTTKDLLARLFSHDHNAVNDHIAGLTTIADFFSGVSPGDEITEQVCLANIDLPLKYVSIKAHEPQPNLISKCLDVVEVILDFLRSISYQLVDQEALCFVPTMVFKVFIGAHPLILVLTCLSAWRRT